MIFLKTRPDKTKPGKNAQGQIEQVLPERFDEESKGQLCQELCALDAECMDYSWGIESWRDFLNSDPGFISLFTFRTPNNLGGLALFQLNPWSKQAHLIKIATRPEYRGLGVASEIFEFSRLALIQAGIEEIYLEVASLNARARAFYGKTGFNELCVKKQFYSDGEDAVAMLLSL